VDSGDGTDSVRGGSGNDSLSASAGDDGIRISNRQMQLATHWEKGSRSVLASSAPDWAPDTLSPAPPASPFRKEPARAMSGSVASTRRVSALHRRR
jgi:hypothetical protein